MCLIALHLPGAAPLTKEQFENAWEQNDDGGGLMFIDNRKLRVFKAYYDCDQFYADYLSIIDVCGAKSPVVAHWRYATHGTMDVDCVHPHWVIKNRIALAHNGILPVEPTKGESDTTYFIRLALRGRSEDQLMSKRFGKRLGRMIGTSNKFVMLSATGNVQIVNEKSGHWDGQSWYSNHCYDNSCQLMRGRWDDDDFLDDPDFRAWANQRGKSSNPEVDEYRDAYGAYLGEVGEA